VVQVAAQPQRPGPQADARGAPHLRYLFCIPRLKPPLALRAITSLTHKPSHDRFDQGKVHLKTILRRTFLQKTPTPRTGGQGSMVGLGNLIGGKGPAIAKPPLPRMASRTLGCQSTFLLGLVESTANGVVRRLLCRTSSLSRSSRCCHSTRRFLSWAFSFGLCESASNSRMRSFSYCSP